MILENVNVLTHYHCIALGTPCTVDIVMSLLKVAYLLAETC
jgi:hypothetical protein